MNLGKRLEERNKANFPAKEKMCILLGQYKCDKGKKKRRWSSFIKHAIAIASAMKQVSQLFYYHLVTGFAFLP